MIYTFYNYINVYLGTAMQERLFTNDLSLASWNVLHMFLVFQFWQQVGVVVERSQTHSKLSGDKNVVSRLHFNNGDSVHRSLYQKLKFFSPNCSYIGPLNIILYMWKLQFLEIKRTGKTSSTLWINQDDFVDWNFGISVNNNLTVIFHIWCSFKYKRFSFVCDRSASNTRISWVNRMIYFDDYV